jgi:hypothetical protein
VSADLIEKNMRRRATFAVVAGTKNANVIGRRIEACIQLRQQHSDQATLTKRLLFDFQTLDAEAGRVVYILRHNQP